MLEYIGVPYQEKRYEAAEKDEWFGQKYNMGFDFPNVCAYYFILTSSLITFSSVALFN